MVVGIIGGSGLSHFGSELGERLMPDTPYGKPSAPLYKAVIGNSTTYFLARHGEGHILLPSEVNSRANIYALKSVGVKKIISISAVGSLRENIHPGDFILPDQYLDLTKGRPHTFFGGGIVAHAHFADPACKSLRNDIASVIRKMKIPLHLGGTYVCMEGPQFSTRSESHWYRSWSWGPSQSSVIGMTALPEARLAREARLCYQTVAIATDYDCWNERQADVSVDGILDILKKAAKASQELVTDLLANPLGDCVQCYQQMENAVMTPKNLWPQGRRKEMEVILA